MCQVLVHPTVSLNIQRVIDLQKNTGRLVVLAKGGAVVRLIATRTTKTEPGPSAA